MNTRSLAPALAFAATAAALLLSTLPAAAQTCGDLETPCEMPNGTYHMRLPADWNGTDALPVLIFYHGHNGTGRSILGNGGLVTDFSDYGYLLIAPNGEGRSHPARASSTGRDDVAYSLDILDDLETRLPIDRGRIYASGFSAGGSMAWLMACEAGEHLAGMVAVAGALRRPNPTECAGLDGLPVLHVHGFSDPQVPFEGRAIRDWHQGSVWDSLARAVEVNGCRSHPDVIETNDVFRTRLWQDSCSGAPVQLAVHDGGHGLPQGWTAMAREFFEAQ